MHLKMVWPVFIRLTRWSVHLNWTTRTCSFALQIVKTAALSAVWPLGMFLHMYVYSVAVSWRGLNRKMRQEQGRCYKCFGGLYPFYQMFSFYKCVSCYMISHWRAVDSIYGTRIILKVCVVLHSRPDWCSDRPVARLQWLRIGHRYRSTKDILNVIEQFCLLLAVKL